jgi:cytosine/adenosine deaminase-related metal-dependent hydrolase
VLLNNLINSHTGRPLHISISREHIVYVGEEDPEPDPFVLYFRDATVIPGLINSHDHLDFNCFQPFGNNRFSNYMEWGHQIHQKFRGEIKSVLDIPQNLRTQWGIYKNLISGVTTVVHHGPALYIENSPIHVFQDVQNLHSIEFEKNWAWKLNNPFRGRRMVVIHTGEGTDLKSVKEIDQLIKYNLLSRDIVGIHGVAMNSIQARKLKALVWCPQSNQILLGQQPDIAGLKKHIQILLGTDSTLTGSWDIWQHLRFARSLHLSTDEELFNMCTRAPAKLWGMNKGELKPGKEADLIVLKYKTNRRAWDLFYENSPEDILMVIQNGKIRLFDECLLPQLRDRISLENFSVINIGKSKKSIEGDLPALAGKIRSVHKQMHFPFQYREQFMQIEKIV